MKMYKRLAKPISYMMAKRNRKVIEYIVIHYTGNREDSAKSNADYFASFNQRNAGAHFFVDQKGNIARSIPMNRIAYSVGGDYRPKEKKSGCGILYNICTNANSVSIELCDNVSKNPSKEQTESVRKLIKYIQRYCPNAKKIVTHYEVNGKNCPIRMTHETEEKEKRWKKFKNEITK